MRDPDDAGGYWDCDEFIQWRFLDAYDNVRWFEGGVQFGASLNV